MSSTAIPTTTKAWAVEGKDGFESLKLKNEVPIPALSENEVLVKIHAASLNYRDLAITKGTLTQNEDDIANQTADMYIQECTRLVSNQESSLVQTVLAK